MRHIVAYDMTLDSTRLATYLKVKQKKFKKIELKMLAIIPHPYDHDTNRFSKIINAVGMLNLKV